MQKIDYLKVNQTINRLIKFDFVEKDFYSFLENEENFQGLEEFLKIKCKDEYLASLCNSITVAYYLESLLPELQIWCERQADDEEFWINNRTYKGSEAIDDESEYTNLALLIDEFNKKSLFWCEIVEEYREIN